MHEKSPRKFLCEERRKFDPGRAIDTRGGEFLLAHLSKLDNLEYTGAGSEVAATINMGPGA